jgi:hypothetical protein
MIALRFVLLTVLVVVTARGQQNSVQQPLVQPGQGAPASCPVSTPPEHPFTPPGAYELGQNDFWLGTEKLWVALNKSGTWTWEPHKPGQEHQVQPLTAKIFWMSVDYDWRTEPSPNITVTGRRLDGASSPLLLMPATHAFSGPTASMLTGVYVTTPGCWEITGNYKDNKLSFVVWVAPTKSGQ